MTTGRRTHQPHGAPGPTGPTGPTDGSTLRVVLAAGGGTRFAGPDHKLLTALHGTTVIEHAVAHALDGASGPVLVVTGAVDVPDAVRTGGAMVEHNERWAEGQATSLQVAVAVARRLGIDAIVVGLGDQPFIEPAAWRAVESSVAPIAIGTYDGRPRNPVRLQRSVWDDLPTSGDEGARVLARMRPELVEQVPCPGTPADIDTLADLHRWQTQPPAEDLPTWQNRSSTNSR